MPDKSRMKSMDEFSNEPNIRAILEKAGKSISDAETKDTNVPSKCPVQEEKQGELSRTAWGQGVKLILKWIKRNDGEHNVSAVQKGLANDGVDINYETIKKNLNRLAKKELIKKIKVGHDSFYSNLHDIKEQDGIIKQEQATELGDSIDELEKRLASTLNIDNKKIDEICFHSIKLIFNPEHIRKKHERDIAEGRLPDPQSIYTPDQMINRVLDRAMSPDSIYQKWHSPHPENIRDIKGGYQETVKLSEQSGFIGKLNFQIFGTGSFIIFGEFSDHPIKLLRIQEFERYISGIMSGRCGYELCDLVDYCSVLFELNLDKRLPNVGVGKADGGFEITLRQFNEYFIRKYTKEIDGEMYLREEVVLTKEVPYNQFLHEVMAAAQGGVSSQVAIRTQFNFERSMERVNQKLLHNDKAIEFLLKDNQQKSIATQALIETNRQILEYLAGKKTAHDKPKQEKPVIQVKKQEPVNKPEHIDQMKSCYKVCQSCKHSYFGVLKKCPKCGKEQVVAG